MTPEQRERAVELLGDGATIRETAALVKLTERAFSAEWVKGRQESEDGVESESASWYRAAQAARASIRATYRAEAADEAGSRRSSDLLAVLSRLEAEDEPAAVAADDHYDRTRLRVESMSQETAMKMQDAFASMLRDETAARDAALPMT